MRGIAAAIQVRIARTRDLVASSAGEHDAPMALRVPGTGLTVVLTDPASSPVGSSTTMLIDTEGNTVPYTPGWKQAPAGSWEDVWAARPDGDQSKPFASRT